MSHAQPHMHAHSQYSHTNDAVDANQKVFDRMAHTWDNPCMRSVSQQNANAVLQLLRATGHLRPDAAVLDFACGGGDITMLLQPHIGSIVGADVSTGMLHLLEQRVSSGHASRALISNPDVGSLPQHLGGETRRHR